MSSVDQIRSFLGTYGSSRDADQEQWLMDFGQRYFAQMQDVPPYATQLLNTSPSDQYLSHPDPYGIGIHEWELPSNLPHQDVPMFLPNHPYYQYPSSDNQQYNYVQPSRVQVPLSSSRHQDFQDFQQLEIDDVEVEIISQAAFDQAKKKAKSNNGTGQHGRSRMEIQLGLGLNPAPAGPAVKNSAVPVEQEGEAVTYRCPICMDKIIEATSTKCGHIFCQGCLKKALAVKKQCPTCRRKLRANSNMKVFLPEIF